MAQIDREDLASTNTASSRATDARVDELSKFWRRLVAKDKKQFLDRMERIRKEEEAPPKPPLYMNAEQKTLHKLVFKYVDRLVAHEEFAERQKAIRDARNLLQTVVLLEK